MKLATDSFVLKNVLNFYVLKKKIDLHLGICCNFCCFLTLVKEKKRASM